MSICEKSINKNLVRSYVPVGQRPPYEDDQITKEITCTIRDNEGIYFTGKSLECFELQCPDCSGHSLYLNFMKRIDRGEV